MSDSYVKIEIRGDGSKLDRALDKSQTRVQRFGRGVKHEFDNIKLAASSVEAKLGTLGISLGAVMLTKQSAQLDKSLTQIGQTAGESRYEVEGLRKALFRMASDTGTELDNLKSSFDNAVQSGLKFREATNVTGAVNIATAVTGAQPERLTSALTVSSVAFDFDLNKPAMALDLLDRFTVAGRQGNAELENLSDIFARMGVNASRAGFGFDSTLSFIEGLSLIERQPERLATLADSTLRLFTNLEYLKKAQSGTGVKFFDAKGARRDPLAVLEDIKRKYDTFKNDAERENFFGTAFKGMDIDTTKGLQTLLKSDMLLKVRGFSREIGNASGTLKRDLPAAIDNAVDQTGRLKARLREAADAFIRPLNQGISQGIKTMLDGNEKGGLGLSGGQLLAGGAGAIASVYALRRFGGPLVKKAIGRLGGAVAGIAEGKAVEAISGVTPVFVTNWPAIGMGGAVADAVGVAGAARAGKILDQFGRPIMTTVEAAGAAKIAGTAVKAAGLAKLLPALGMGLGTTAAITGVVGATGLAGGWMLGKGLDDLLYKHTGSDITGTHKIDAMWRGMEEEKRFLADRRAAKEGGPRLADLLQKISKQEAPEVKNDIVIHLRVDQAGHMTASTPNMANTRINVPRGKQ